MTRALVAFIVFFGIALSRAGVATFAAQVSPSGAVSIVFGEKLVDAKPGRIVGARVMAPLIRGDEILMPFRDVIYFQGPLGEKPRISYDAATGTVEISKPADGGAAGASFDLRLSVGKKYVIINGRRHSLDIAPEIVHGSLIVPVRPIVEALQAYADWNAAKRLVVVGLNPSAAKHRDRRYVSVAAAVVITAPLAALLAPHTVPPVGAPPPPSVPPVAALPPPSVPPVAALPPPSVPPAGAEPPPVTSSRLGFFNDQDRDHGVISPNDKRRYGRYSYVLLAKDDDRARSFIRSLLGAVVENPGQSIAVGAPLPDSPSEDTHRWNVFFVPVTANTKPIAVDQGENTVSAILGRYEFAKARDLLSAYCFDVPYHARRTLCSNTFTGPIILTFLAPLPATVAAGSYPRAFAYDFGAAPPDQFGITLTQIESDIALTTQVDRDAYLPPSLQIHIANSINYAMYSIAQIAPLVHSFTDYAFGRETAH